jgi:hypothetical protein
VDAHGNSKSANVDRADLTIRPNGLILVLVEESTHMHTTHTSVEARNTQTDRVDK